MLSMRALIAIFGSILAVAPLRGAEWSGYDAAHPGDFSPQPAYDAIPSKLPSDSPEWRSADSTARRPEELWSGAPAPILVAAHVKAAAPDPFAMPLADPPPPPNVLPNAELWSNGAPPPGFVDAGFDYGHHDYLDCESCPQPACLPRWAHRSGLFAEFLYLRPRNAEVTYAVPIDGPIVPPPATPLQVGEFAVNDPDFASAYRGGLTYALDDCSSITASFMRYENNGFDSAAVTAPIVLRDLVLHPSAANAGANYQSVSSDYGIDLDLADLEYREVFSSSELHAINYSVGVRYARLDQNFQGDFVGPGFVETLITDVNFDGIGLRLGIDAERHACNHGMLIYGKTAASLLGGEFRGRFFESSTFDPVVADTTWSAGRLVSVLDLEVGVGWQSRCGRLRWTVGYMFSAWLNTIAADSFIQAVRANDFVDLNDRISFDGLTSRLEYRF